MWRVALWCQICARRGLAGGDEELRAESVQKCGADKPRSEVMSKPIPGATKTAYHGDAPMSERTVCEILIYYGVSGVSAVLHLPKATVHPGVSQSICIPACSCRCLRVKLQHVVVVVVVLHLWFRSIQQTQEGMPAPLLMGVNGAPLSSNNTNNTIYCTQQESRCC